MEPNTGELAGDGESLVDNPGARSGSSLTSFPLMRLSADLGSRRVR